MKRLLLTFLVFNSFLIAENSKGAQNSDPSPKAFPVERVVIPADPPQACGKNYVPRPCKCPSENCQDIADEKLGLSMLIWGLVMSVGVALMTGFMHNTGVSDEAAS